MPNIKLRILTITALTMIVLSFSAGLGVITATQSNQNIEFKVLETVQSTPVETIELSQSSQSLDFTLGSWDDRIIQCAYSASHLNTRFTYRISFSVQGGSIEFFICSSSKASTWDQGYPIYIDPADHWPSTSGVTTTRSYKSNVALSFVFNYEGSDSRVVTGTITIDTAGPDIISSLVNNETYSGVVPITANATDSFCDVDSMQLYINGNEREDMDGASLDYNWNTGSYANGNHTISIIAEDTYGLLTNVTYVVWVENEGFVFPGVDTMGLIAGAGLFGVFVIYFIVKRSKTPG